MVSWPLKIEQMCERKLDVLLEDEDKYLRQLESDVITLSERLDNNQVNTHSGDVRVPGWVPGWGGARRGGAGRGEAGRGISHEIGGLEVP